MYHVQIEFRRSMRLRSFHGKELGINRVSRLLYWNEIGTPQPMITFYYPPVGNSAIGRGTSPGEITLAMKDIASMEVT